MNMDIWVVVHQMNSLQEVLKPKKHFKGTKAFAGKTLSFVIGPFCTCHSICRNIGF